MRLNDSHTETSPLKHYLNKILSLKYFYIVSIALFLAGAHLYNKNSGKIYEVSSTIGPVKDSKTTILASNNMFGSTNAISPRRNIEDDINNLMSYSLIASTVNNLDFETGYFSEKKGLIRQATEIYKNSPFRVTMDKSHTQPINCKLYIRTLNDSTYLLSIPEQTISLYNYIDNKVLKEEISFSLDTIAHFNRIISGSYFRFSIAQNRENSTVVNNDEYLYYFRFYHPDNLAMSYLNRLEITPVSFMASIINLRFRGENIEKSITFLNNYINAFMEDNLAKKNKIALNTVEFIDSQLSEVSDSLVASESLLRNFKSANQVTDLGFQGERIYDQLEQIDRERAELGVKKRYYEYVINFFKANSDIRGVMPPVSANISDPVMNQLMTDILDLNSQRSEILNTSSDKNLYLDQIEHKLDMQKNLIIENARNNLNTLNLSINELDYRSEKLTEEISRLPRTELNMVSIERKFKLNNEIYTFLLEKRAEAAITLASSYPDYEILEEARFNSSKVIKPKNRTNFMLAFILGLFIPSLYLLIREIFDDKINSSYDIRSYAGDSVIARIFNNRFKNNNVFEASPGSATAESFRSLRSNMIFKLKNQGKKTILITSSQPKDGKSFISYNLGVAFASVGLKTALVDIDLRRPTLHKKFDLENETGLSTYMNGKSGLKEIITPAQPENLFVVTAGPIIPNTSELIENGALDDFFGYLESEFDYIIIDSSPLGIVSDTSQLLRYTSKVILIARNKYTRKTTFQNATEILEKYSINDFDVVLNDVELRKSPYSGYSNYYTK